jgi:hypothetical protein
MSLALFWRQRTGAADEARNLRDELHKECGHCAEQLSGLKRDFEALELSFQSTREVLNPRRLNRSSRAQALQLLRTGVAADTAASTLGIAKREIRLLARVARILSAD